MGWRRGTPGRLIRAWWRFLDLVEHWYWSASFEIWQLIPLRWRKVKVKAAPPPPEEEEYPWDPDPELDEWDTEPPLQFSIEPSEFEVGPTSEMFNCWIRPMQTFVDDTQNESFIRCGACRAKTCAGCEYA